MFEQITAEALAELVYARIIEDGTWSTEEGTLPSLLVLPICTEIFKIYKEFDTLLSKVWVDEGSGAWLDVCAQTLGITRKGGSYANCQVDFGGIEGTFIPAGFAILTADEIEFLTTSDTVISAELTASVIATSSSIGSQNNISAGEIIRARESLTGITSISNHLASGGSDTESDSALFARISARRQEPATSGNASHYKQWALEVSPVSFAKVLPLARGNGTVDVLVCDSQNMPLTTDRLTLCEDYIESLRPIGADCEVSNADSVNIDVSAVIRLQSGQSLEAVDIKFREDLAIYFSELAQIWSESSENAVTISKNRIIYLLMGNSAVVDVLSIKLNSSDSDVILTNRQVPSVGGILIETG